jgi:hypothetical protein
MEDAAFVTEPLFGAAYCHPQRGEVSAAAVRQLDAFAVVPDACGRVELRRLAREVLEVEARGGSAAQKVLDRLAAMNRRAIPQDEHLAANHAQQHA